MAPPAAGNRLGHPLSEVLIAIVRTATAPRISVGYLLLALKDRALGALILVFAATNVMPTPPGTSTVLGIPLI
ncbi:MAG: exopolysaccharide biosynthesis protein, partial [Rhodospirillaceae bacterium]